MKVAQEKQLQYINITLMELYEYPDVVFLQLAQMKQSLL